MTSRPRAEGAAFDADTHPSEGVGVASPLASPSATRAVLERHGFSLKKSLGQNFLVNDAIVGKILQLAEVGPDDVVLEVGPGIGTLTHALLQHVRGVVSIERDVALPAVLEDTLSEFDSRFALLAKDALDVTADDVHAAAESIGATFPNKMVANLPYAVAATVVLDYFQRFGLGAISAEDDGRVMGTVLLTRAVLDERDGLENPCACQKNRPHDTAGLSSMTVMVQREVADRMMAQPGSKNYGAYTVKLAMYARSAGWFSVGPGNFMPPPRVESAVLRLDRHALDADPAVVEAACTMADAAFFARRKTIANSCRQYFAGRNASIAEALPTIFEAAGVDPKVRGEALSPETYLALGRAFAERNPER